jgi:hypothetical protein
VGVIAGVLRLFFVTGIGRTVRAWVSVRGSESVPRRIVEVADSDLLFVLFFVRPTAR